MHASIAVHAANSKNVNPRLIFEANVWPLRLQTRVRAGLQYESRPLLDLFFLLHIRFQCSHHMPVVGLNR